MYSEFLTAKYEFNKPHFFVLWIHNIFSNSFILSTSLNSSSHPASTITFPPSPNVCPSPMALSHCVSGWSEPPLYQLQPFLLYTVPASHASCRNWLSTSPPCYFWSLLCDSGIFSLLISTVQPLLDIFIRHSSSPGYLFSSLFLNIQLHFLYLLPHTCFPKRLKKSGSLNEGTFLQSECCSTWKVTRAGEHVWPFMLLNKQRSRKHPALPRYCQSCEQDLHKITK